MVITIQDNSGQEVHAFKLSDMVQEVFEKLRTAQAKEEQPPTVPEFIEYLVFSTYKNVLQTRPDFYPETLKVDYDAAKLALEEKIAAQVTAALEEGRSAGRKK